VTSCAETTWGNDSAADHPVCSACDSGSCLWCSTSATTCTKCDSGNNEYLEGTTCVTSCANEYWEDANGGDPQCSACSADCKECDSSGTDCTRCNAGKFLEGSTCVTNCAETTWGNAVDDADYPVCSACSADCQDCTTSATSCASCPDTSKYLYGTSCVDCPSFCPDSLC
jgi:hypothetical protein